MPDRINHPAVWVAAIVYSFVLVLILAYATAIAITPAGRSNRG